MRIRTVFPSLNRLPLIGMLLLLLLALPLIVFLSQQPKQYAASNNAALHVVGDKLVDGNGQTVLLRGAMIDGEFDYINAWQSNTVPDLFNPTVFAAMHSFGMNALRLPFSEWIMQQYPTYQAKLDAAVAAANAAGLYVILDFHDNTKSGSPTGVPMLHPTSIAWWKTVATHYLANPMVLYDVENEPTYTSWTQWAHGDGTVSGELDALAAIRSAGSQAIVIFEPGGGANDAAGGWSNFPTNLITDPNIMFSKHMYHTIVTSTTQSLDATWGTVLGKYPIFYGEWGILPVQDRQCVGISPANADQITNNFLNYMALRNASFTAYAFQTNYLVQNTTSFQPTDFSGSWTCGTTQAHTKGMGADIKVFLASHPLATGGVPALKNGSQFPAPTAPYATPTFYCGGSQNCVPSGSPTPTIFGVTPLPSSHIPLPSMSGNPHLQISQLPSGQPSTIQPSQGQNAQPHQKQSKINQAKKLINKLRLAIRLLRQHKNHKGLLRQLTGFLSRTIKKLHTLLGSRYSGGGHTPNIPKPTSPQPTMKQPHQKNPSVVPSQTVTSSPSRSPGITTTPSAGGTPPTTGNNFSLQAGILDPSPPALPNPVPMIEQAQWTIEQSHVSYVTIGSTAYIFNIYVKNPPPAGNTPLVLYFHGCCNQGKENNPDIALDLGRTPTSPLEWMFRALLNNGYRVAAMGYPVTLPPTTDTAIAAKAAVRFMRANAQQYHIDPTRIVAWGSSGGGLPVTVLGTADTTAGFDVGANLNFSSRVEAVLDWYGDPSLVKPAYVTSDDSPTLIQHGVNDTNVPTSESVTLFNELTAAHVFTELQWVYGAAHEFAGNPNPPFGSIVDTALRFLNTMVRDNPHPLPQ